MLEETYSCLVRISHGNSSFIKNSGPTSQWHFWGFRSGTGPNNHTFTFHHCKMFQLRTENVTALRRKKKKKKQLIVSNYSSILLCTTERQIGVTRRETCDVYFPLQTGFFLCTILWKSKNFQKQSIKCKERRKEKLASLWMKSHSRGKECLVGGSVSIKNSCQKSNEAASSWRVGNLGEQRDEGKQQKVDDSGFEASQPLLHTPPPSPGGLKPHVATCECCVKLACLWRFY